MLPLGGGAAKRLPSPAKHLFLGRAAIMEWSPAVCRGQAPEGGPASNLTRHAGKESVAISAADSSTRKRRKIDVACEDCRDRKRKCDGVRPRCGGCSKRGPQQGCVYIQSTWKLSKPPRRIERSPTQVSQLRSEYRAEEAQFLRLNNVATANFPQTTPPIPDDNPNHVHPETTKPFSDGANIDKNRSAKSISGWTDRIDTIQESGRQFGIRQSSIDTILEDEIGSMYGRGSFKEVSGVPLTPPITLGESNTRETQKSSVNAMGAPSGSHANDAREARTLDSYFFGPSSVISFMSKVQRTILNSKFIPPMGLIGGHSSVGPRNGTTGRENFDFADSWSERTLNVNHESTDYLIPTRSEADLFLESYFTNIHVLHPFIHRATFMEQYHKLWTADDPGTDPIQRGSAETFRNEIQRQVFYVTLNLVFALGCRSESSLSAYERISKSERLFMRTQNPRIYELLNHGSLELVQSMILMGHYLQATERSAKCWNVVGLAIRVAIGIGLHLEAPKNTTYSQLELEIRRRVWGGCLILDREISMTYGRPCMIHHLMSRSIQLPSIIDDNLLTSSLSSHVSQIKGAPSLMAFFVHLLSLSEILSKVLHTQYFQDGGQLEGTLLAGATGSYDFQAVLLLDASLTKWQNDLPPFLSTPENDEGIGGDAIRNETFGHNPLLKSLYDLQALALHSQQRHIRILLLRPLLIALFDKEHGSSNTGMDTTLLNTIFQQNALTNFSNVCVSTAQRQVDVLTDTPGKISDPTHAWWYKVYYLYTCAIVILIGRLCPSIDGIGSQRDLAVSWERCLCGLKWYFEFSQAAQKGYEALEMIDERIFKTRTSNPRYSQNNLSDDFSHIGDEGLHQNLEPVSELDVAGLLPSALALDSRTTNPDEVSLNIVGALNSNTDSSLIDAELDMNWSWNDLQLDFLNSMPFAGDFRDGGIGLI